MVSSNTETNITITYQDSDGTLDFVVDAAQPNVTSLGTLTSLTVDDVVIDGAVIGHTSDTDLITLSSGVVTVAGELDATSLDISGDADIDGTLEADAITIGGVTLAETISDTVGAMVTSNTESGITVAYQDADNTLDFTIGTLNQDTTGTAAVATTVTITDNESTNEENAVVFTAGGDVDGGNLGLESDGNLTYNPSSGTLTATAFAGALTGNVTGNASGTAATVTGAAQSNITSLGTLTTLTVDNVIINGTTIGHTSDTDLMTLADGVLTVAGEVDATSLDVSGDIDVDGTTNLDVVDIDGAVDMASTLTVAGVVDITDTTDSSDATGDTGALRTEGGASIAKKLYVGTDLDVDGTANLDNTDIDGTLNTSGVVTSQTSANISQVAISSSSNATAWDAAAAANAYYVTSENTTISAPSNAVEGAIISIEIAQGGTARTVAWNTVFEFAASTAPTVTATANKTDIFAFRYNGSVWQEIGRSQNMAQT
jgi:cytoskeletal protein CcmA (bactofilin family)